jgi:hypothetical protein
VSDFQHLVDGIKSGVKTRKKLSGGLIGETNLVTFKDGTRAVHKIGSDRLVETDPVSQAAAEQLGSLLARALGIPAPKVFRHSDTEIYMEFVDGKVAADFITDEGPLKRAHNSDLGRMIGVFDLITGNWDRNPGNYMIDRDGNPVPIDHGLLWDPDPNAAGTTGGIPFRVSPFARAFVDVNPFAGFFGGRGGEWVDNDMTPADIRAIRDRMEKLRPDFQHAGREPWLDFSLRRLEVLGSHAKGRRNRIAAPPVRGVAIPPAKAIASTMPDPPELQMAKLFDAVGRPAGVDAAGEFNFARAELLQRGGDPVAVVRRLRRVVDRIEVGAAERRGERKQRMLGGRDALLRLAAGIERIAGLPVGTSQPKRRRPAAAARRLVDRWGDLPGGPDRALAAQPVAVVREVAKIKLAGRRDLADLGKMPKHRVLELLFPRQWR